jgi:OOP family OmpA-OmpF porin
MMGATRSVFTAVVLGLAPTLGSAGGDLPDEYAWLGVHLSQYWPYHEEIGADFIEEATLPGAQLGYRAPMGFSVQALWQRDEARFPNSSRQARITNSWVSLRRHLDGGLVEPYLGVNVGELVFRTGEANDETMLGVEAGVQTRIQPHWVLDLGARAPHSLDNERFDFQAWIGLNHVFGINRTESPTRAEVEEKETADKDGGQSSLRDTDRDGVPDEDDDCPGTEAGRRVNASGCIPSS